MHPFHLSARVCPLDPVALCRVELESKPENILAELAKLRLESDDYATRFSGGDRVGAGRGTWALIAAVWVQGVTVFK